MIDIIKLTNEAGLSASFALNDFITKNNLSEDKVSVSVCPATKKIIVRIFDTEWTVEKNRSAQNTVYHGQAADIYTWCCFTRTSGMLEFDDYLTDEYHYKCSN
ncbi:MAG: hypothetical protein IJH39_05640 [Clostridia bacterium]|nr:hypothetical protein [Clostridia bacterium]